MDIIKLSDDKTKTMSSRHASSRPSLRGSLLSPLPSSRTVSSDIVSGFFITNLKQGIRNPNRVNVFINDKYEFSLDLTQVVDYMLKVGRELTEEELAELKKASEFGKLYQRTLEWVLTRPHSIRETKDYLNKKIFEKKLDKKYIDLIIERLINKKYLDDRKFAEFYVENRFVKKGVSQKRLRMELMKKGVDKEIIEEVLDERDDEEEIRKMAMRKRTKYDDEKLTAYLCRQGFSYDLVRKVVIEFND